MKFEEGQMTLKATSAHGYLSKSYVYTMLLIPRLDENAP